MKYAKMMVAVLLTLAFVAALLSGCSEQAKEAGEITDYDSQAFIPVGDSSDTSSKEPTEYSENTTQTGGFVVSEKTYDFEGNNLVVLNVENQTDKNYTITICGQYIDENGTVIKEENKTFEGFSAGWKNNFFFIPNIQFKRFTYTMDAEEYAGECYAQTMHYVWQLEESELGITSEDWSKMIEEGNSYTEALANGQSDAPLPPNRFSAVINFGLGVQSDATQDIMIVLDVIILNSKGEIIAVQPQWFRKKVELAYAGNGNTQWSGKAFYSFSGENREWPAELNGELTVLFSTVDAYLWIGE